MTTTANPIQRGAVASPQPIAAQEDSTLLKALSCVPLVGIISSLIQESSLHRKIAQTEDAPRLIKLIDVKNQYKMANAIRNLISAALAVAGIALGIISATFVRGVIITGLHVGVVAINIYQISKNLEVIKELRSTGFRPGMNIA